MHQVSDSGKLDWDSRYRTSPCCLPAIASSGEFPILRNSGIRKPELGSGRAFPIVAQGRHSQTVISDLPGEIHEVTAKRISLGLYTAPVEDPDSSGYIPLLTLRHAITGHRRIARGQSGSLLLTL